MTDEFTVDILSVAELSLVEFDDGGYPSVPHAGREILALDWAQGWLRGVLGYTAPPEGSPLYWGWFCGHYDAEYRNANKDTLSVKEVGHYWYQFATVEAILF
jgi:hypothetical protein